jgi:hypothetical protein
MSRQQGGSAGEHEDAAAATCPRCLATETRQVEAQDVETVAAPEAGWTKQLAAEIDARDGQTAEDAGDGGLEQRVGAEIDLDPLTAATLIVAEEDKRLSD